LTRVVASGGLQAVLGGAADIDGGLSNGPKTVEGRARIAASHHQRARGHIDGAISWASSKTGKMSKTGKVTG